MWEAPWHWVVLAIIVIALLGYKKLPDAARSIGRSMRIFKTEIKGMGDDDKKRATTAEPKALESPKPVAGTPLDGGASATTAETAPRVAPSPRPRPGNPVPSPRPSSPAAQSVRQGEPTPD